MDGFIWVALMFGVIWGLVCSSMAKNKGRDGVGGFIGGLIFGLFAVIYYATREESVEIKAQKQLEVESYKQNMKSDSSNIEQLEKLAKLKKDGHITEKEFEAKKKQLLGL